MKPIDKLTTLLCENERVNEDMNKIKNYDISDEIIHKLKKSGVEIEYTKNIVIERVLNKYCKKSLLERHLRMYCESNLKNTEFVGNGFITYSCEGYDNDIYFGSYDLYKIELDNTKDLYEQSDSVIERIYNFLIESKKGQK